MAIPLKDGTYQAVRALSVKQITRRKPQMDYRPALKKVQDNYPGNQELQDLQIPEMLGGEIDVLLGIGYNRIYPEIVHTLPSGLQIIKNTSFYLQHPVKLAVWEVHSELLIASSVL